MKAPFTLDASCDYGDATPAIQQIISEWNEIDWFAPVRDEAAASRARAFFEEHNALGRTVLPESFPEKISLHIEHGGWDDFSAHVERAKHASSWDWRHEALKMVCHRHSSGLGWDFRKQAERECDSFFAGKKTLFLANDAFAFWAFDPRIDPNAIVRATEPNRKDALGYFNYATMDATHAFEWQLAEKHSRLDGNPFIPLLRCYREGFFPFCPERGVVALFAFR